MVTPGSHQEGVVAVLGESRVESRGLLPHQRQTLRLSGVCREGSARRIWGGTRFPLFRAGRRKRRSKSTAGFPGVEAEAMQPEEETKNMKKRLLAMLMVLSMALSILPMSAVAVGNGEAREYQDQIVKQGEEIVTSEGKVKHSKIIQQTGENTFDITLQVKTSEEIKEQVVSEDAAVVLVLDQSSSMTYNNIKDLKKSDIWIC